MSATFKYNSNKNSINLRKKWHDLNFLDEESDYLHVGLNKLKCKYEVLLVVLFAKLWFL